MKNTRIEFWQAYRNDIERNIALQQAVRLSNQKYTSIEKRLLTILPFYKKKYMTSKSQPIIEGKQVIEKAPKIDYDELEVILRQFNELEALNNGFASNFENISFSSWTELDGIKNKIKANRNRNAHDNEKNKGEFALNEPKKIFLSPPKNDEGFMANKTSESNEKKLWIAIDGPSGSGKSSVAKALAKKYHLTYINTGLIYRALALNIIKKQVDFNDHQAVVKTLTTKMIELLPNEVVMLNGQNVSSQVRSEVVSQTASKIAALPEVRAFAQHVSLQYAKRPNTIMDGRDTTFKIMPHANVKIFLETSPEIRAKRRLDQNRELGFKDNYEQILQDIIERDARDRSRKIDPLHQTKDAILVDASNLSLEEVIKVISQIVERVKEEK